MRDVDIRSRLRDGLATKFAGDLIRNEVGLCLGETRVDLAVVNGHIHGYEIKSDRDTLARLPSQIELYDRVLDYSTIVCGPRHLANVIDQVPERWGVIEASGAPGAVKLHQRRRPKLNRELDPLSIAQLLWRDEAADVLVSVGQQVRRRDTRWDLWDRLALLPLTKLQLHVRTALKARRAWPGG